MTHAQESAIYTAIHADAEAHAYAAVGNDDAVTAWLNTPTIKVHRHVNSDQLMRWAAKCGAMSKLEAEVAHGTNGKREISKIALKLFDRTNIVIELDEDIIGMLDTLVAGGVFTADDKADLMSRAAEVISLAEFLCGRLATIADVGRILAVDRPNGKIPAEVPNGVA